MCLSEITFVKSFVKLLNRIRAALTGCQAQLVAAVEDLNRRQKADCGGQHLFFFSPNLLQCNFWRRSQSVMPTGSQLKLQFVPGRTTAVSPICFADGAAFAASTVGETSGLKTLLTVELKEAAN